jgi:hypothetical protein
MLQAKFYPSLSEAHGSIRASGIKVSWSFSFIVLSHWLFNIPFLYKTNI